MTTILCIVLYLAGMALVLAFFRGAQRASEDQFARDIADAAERGERYIRSGYQPAATGADPPEAPTRQP